MIVNRKNGNFKTMFCKCGCANGVVLRADNEKDFGISLRLVSDNFYMCNGNIINSFKEKVKRIWYIISGKEYCYFDILIEPKELQEFKEFVARL